MEQERITLYPDKDLKKQIEDIAKSEKRSVNNFILLLLENHIKRQKVKKIKNKK